MSFLDSLPDYGAAPPQPQQSNGGASFLDSLPDYGSSQVEQGKTAPLRVYIGDRQQDEPPVSTGQRLLTDFQNQGIAAGQRTTPIISAQAPNLISDDVYQNDAGDVQYKDPQTGQILTTDQAKQVVLRDPADQKLKVYARTDGITGTNEGVLSSLGRILSMGAASNAPTRLPGGFAAPLAPAANGPLGVTLSTGQATGQLPLIQREQAALRGTSGPAVQGRAQQFADQQAQQIAAARDTVAQSLNPAGGVVAASPQEAGQVVSSGVRGAAANAKAGVNAAYQTARDLPGEIKPGALQGLPQKIKTSLTESDSPVIIDASTPNASKMIDYIDQKIGNLSIPNKADPLGHPASTTETRTILSGPGYHIADDVSAPPNIVGVSLKGVEQWRKALSEFRSDALKTPNASDQRAVKAVMDAFDKHINEAVNSGAFTGDPKAVQAYNEARAAHSAYKRAFSAGPGDAAGRAIEKIIGKNGNPAAIPNDVADFLYGASGTNPSSLNVAVANRLKSVLGDASPQWSAVKQGLFSRIVDAGEGMTQFGPGKVAQRINKFLNNDGKELSGVLFKPEERALIQQYGDLMRQLEVPQAGANWSNTATFTSKALKKTGHLGAVLGTLIGSAVGHATGMPEMVGEVIGAGVGSGFGGMASKASDALAVRSIAKQMPLVRVSVARYQKALENYQRSQLPAARSSLSTATANLAAALRPLGIDIKEIGSMQGAVNTRADDEQRKP